MPYFPKNLTYPTNFKGEYLQLLAQLNFAEIPSLDKFPQSGILQFYIDRNDECYGLDFNNPFQQDKFRVLYFPEIDDNPENLCTNFDFLATDKPNYYFPIRGEFSLQFTSKVEPISPFDQTLSQILQQSNSFRELYAQFYEQNFNEMGHKLGGYPDFTQSDPRIEFSQENEPYLLLLQIDSEYLDNQLEICWGDVGISNFFIQSSRLTNLDFSQVLYNWDCT